jgi:hypothetical protein
MNKFKNYLYKLIQIFKKRQFWIYVAVLVVGFGLGNVFNDQLVHSDSKVSSSDRKSSASGNRGQQQRQEALNRRVESGYERVKKSVDSDLKANKLTEEKADTILKKQEEIYNFKKNSGQEENRDELNKKRNEWRDWAQQNQVSMKYILPLL